MTWLINRLFPPPVYRPTAGVRNLLLGMIHLTTRGMRAHDRRRYLED